MSENDWPSRPGVPANPERDGWHWLLPPDEKAARPLLWTAGGKDIVGEYQPMWWGTPWSIAELLAKDGWRYLGPCLTPAEITAREAASAEAMREACAASCMEPVANTIPRRWKSDRDCVEGIYALPIPRADALAARIEQAKAEGMQEALKICRDYAEAHERDHPDMRTCEADSIVDLIEWEIRARAVKKESWE